MTSNKVKNFLYYTSLFVTSAYDAYSISNGDKAGLSLLVLGSKFWSPMNRLDKLNYDAHMASTRRQQKISQYKKARLQATVNHHAEFSTYVFASGAVLGLATQCAVNYLK